MKYNGIEFISLETISKEIETQVRTLFLELSDMEQISVRELLESENPPYIALYWQEGILAGMATMATYNVISGRKAWIEDVVVSENFRQRGIGQALTESLIAQAKKCNIKTILLFSNPKREAAHRLYKRMGFIEKGSTLFYKEL